MTTGPARVVLLDAHHRGAELSDVLADLELSGSVALITAGWQEWEEDDQGLRERLGREAVNLRLYGRAQDVWREDPELARGHRELQDRVRALRRAYNLRLAHAMDAWIQLEGLNGDGAVLEGERTSAMETVRELDVHHAHRVRELRLAYHDRFDPLVRERVVRQRDEIGELLGRSQVVVVAGGHVAVLLNRIRLFGLDRMLEGKTVVATGGGCMALAHRVVLFHDSPPWGPGHAEVGEVGSGLYPGVIPLPSPGVRLRLDDPGRVSRMARRFAPDSCLLLDPGTRAEWDGGTWTTRGARRLSPGGHPEPWDGRNTPSLEAAWPSRS